MATFERPKSKKSQVPCCPNHSEPLEGLPVPLTSKGTGICPISKCSFDYEVELDSETQTYEKDHLGNLHAVPQYKVTGDER